MIVLNTTTRKLQIVLAGAPSTQLPVMVGYQDTRIQDGQTSYGETPNTTNSTTAVDILAAPGSGVLRQVNEITVHNADSAAATVTIRYNDNGTTYIIMKVVLAVGDNLIYQAED